MVLLKLTTKNSIECEEMPLSKALQIINFYDKKDYRFEIISDPQKIEVIKEFFGKSTFNIAMCYANKIQSIKDQIYREVYRTKITNIGKLDIRYADAVAYFTLIYEHNITLGYVPLQVKNVEDSIDNFIGCVKLSMLKLDSGINSVIGGYLNIITFKDLLYPIHPELFKYINKDQELEVYVDSRFKDYYITVKNNLIICEINSKMKVFGKLRDGVIVGIEVLDQYFIDSYGLENATKTELSKFCEMYKKYTL